MQIMKQAVFMLGENEYSLDIMDVVAIEKVQTIEPVSSFTQNFKGVITLRGEIIPVYSLRRKFGLDDVEADLDTRLIISTSNNMQIAYEVDKMLEIVQLSDSQLSETPAIVKENNTSYMKSVMKVHNNLVINLNKDGILTEEEFANMNSEINKIKNKKAEQEKAEQLRAEQEKAEQLKAEQEKAEQEKAEQEKAE